MGCSYRPLIGKSRPKLATKPSVVYTTKAGLWVLLRKPCRKVLGAWLLSFKNRQLDFVEFGRAQRS